jgi:iron complex outermembrane receptor protein
LETFDFVVASELGSVGNTFLEGAIGYQYRKNSRSQTEPALRRSATSVNPYTFETIAVTNDAFYGTAITTYDKSQTVQALFMELKMGVGEDVDVQLAVRYEDYDNIGSSLDPKIAVKWQATDSLAFRGSWGTAFRAPNIGLLFEGSGYDGAGAIDPLKLLAVRNGYCAPTSTAADIGTCLGTLAATGDYTASELESQSAIAIFLKRGLPSPDLKPEESENYNLGVIWAPEGALDGLTIGLDYFNVEYTKAIGPTPFSTSLAPETALFNSVSGPGNEGNYIIKGTTTACTPDFANPKSGCVVNPTLYMVSHIDRIGTEAALGIIRFVDINLSTISTDGLEFVLDYSWDTDFGAFMLHNDIYWSHEYVIDDGQTKLDVAGTNASGSTFARSLPDLKSNLSWMKDRHAVTAITRYIHDYYDTLYDNTIPSYTTLDLRYDFDWSFSGDKIATFTLGANDIFDEDLPGRGSERGYDTTVFDPRGRIFYAKIGMSW